MSPLIITIINNLRLENVPPELSAVLTEKLEILNPKWVENERMGRWNRGTPKSLRFYDKVGRTGLWIPRGYMRQLILLCRKYDLKYEIDDQRRRLAPVDFPLKENCGRFSRSRWTACWQKISAP